MTPDVVCPVCERRHTIEEYEEDRFCRTCHKLLEIRRQRRATKRGWSKLFPYIPYPPQVGFMDDVERVVGGGKALIAEACNGFGKTVSSLAVLLSMDRPIIYATRTHEQVRQVLAEVSIINDKSGESFSAVNLASRQHLCLNENCRNLPLRDAQDMCGILREEGECPWGADITKLPRGLPAVMTQKVLMRMGRRSDVCPYYLARKVSKSCGIVVVPYPYVFNKRVRFGVGLELTGRILILDEGHNLDKVGQETLSDTLPEFILEIASEELKAIKWPTRHMTRLARYIRENVNEKPVLKTAETLERELELMLGADLHFFLDKYAEAVEHIRAYKMNLGDPPVSYLNGVLTFIELVSESPKDKYTVLYHKNGRGVNTIEYYCLDPGLAVQPLIQEVKGALIMSGTLSPLDLFADVIGLGGAEYKSYLSIQDPKKIRTYIDSHVTTTYRERSEEMILRIGRRIASELEKVENGALVFFPQRGFMHRCLDVWGVNGVIKTQRGRLQIGGKPLFIEGNNAVSNRDVVSRYKRSAVGPKGAVLNCVFRGRNSEGSNFPDQQARGIFLVGVPYANYGDPFVRAQISYYDKKSRGLGQGWYAMDAFRAANQALGRGIRGIDDWCHYWLLDRRYSRNIDLISKWAVSTPPEHLSALDTIPFGFSVFDGD